MFGDGARLDDIMNVLKPPTLDDDEDKKKERITDAGIRYASRKDIVGSDNVQMEFTGIRNSEVLK